MARLTTDEQIWSRVAVVGVVVLAVALPLSTLVTFGFYPGGVHDQWGVGDREALAAWVLVAAFVPLHLGHVRHGLRDEVPPHGRVTFGVMLAVMVAGEVVVGHVWTGMLASLVASALLVFRGPWGAVWAAAILVACYPLGTEVFGEGGWYVTFVVAFRSTTLFTLVWLVAGVRRIALAREVLARRSAVRERSRVDAELLSSLRVELARIEAQARRAVAEHASGDLDATREAVTDVTGSSRTALAGARRVVADLRNPSSRESLQAAARLLTEAAP